MLQKIVIGLLALTLIGAVGIGMYDASRQTSDASTPDVLANPASAESAPIGDGQPVALAQTVTATPTAPAAPQAADGTGPVALEQQQNQSLSMVGEPWLASGTIALLDATGFNLALDDGGELYVELGPSSYWGAQGVTLVAGDRVTVEGFYNGQQAHAGTVTKANGSQIAVRTATGQPLWSGGAAGGNAGGTAGAGAAEAVVAAEDWVTINGTVTSLVNSTLNVQTDTGEALAIQLGEPTFWQAQGVTFAPGDAVTVLGFWQGTQFQVGEVGKTATGERVMLRDPNGRPLWAGPGRSGNANGGAGGQGAQGGQGQGAQGQGQGAKGQSQGQGVLVPATQWETLRGSVTMIEPLALTLQTQAGETVRVLLGQVDFWSEQGIWFSVRDMLDVQGYWLNGQFEAGELTFAASGKQLTIRDQNGRLLWTGAQGNQGQGNQGAGGAQGGQGQGNEAPGTTYSAQGTQGRQFRGGRQ